MNDELMRKISDAMDSEDGVAGDPELLKAMAETPEAARYAKHLSRLQRWMAAWPVAEPSEADLEALAVKIEERLGEKFSGDYTRAPDFEEDEELASVTSGLLHAGDLTKDLPTEASESLELTMSAITELADRVNEEAAAVPLAKVPLKRGPNGAKADATLPHLAPPSPDDDLPAKKPALPKVPGPRTAAPTMIGNAHDATKAEAKDDTSKQVAAAKAEGVKDAPTPASSGTTGKQAAVKDAEIKPPPPPSGTTGKHAAAKDAEIKPPPPPSGTTGKHAAAKDAEIKPPPPPKAKDDTGKHATAAKPPAPPAGKSDAKSAKPRADERVSIPVPAAGPRLELIEGGAAKRASVAPEPKRAWLPALLAAAAIGLGVLGVGTLMTSTSGAPDARVAAPAAATVAPTAAGASSPPALAEAPSQAAADPSAQMQSPEPMPAPPPAAPVAAMTTVAERAMADDGAMAEGSAAPTSGAPATSTGGASTGAALRVAGAGGGGGGSGLSPAGPAARARGGAPRGGEASAAEDAEASLGQGSSGAQPAATQSGRRAASADTQPAEAARPATVAREAPTPPVTSRPTSSGPAVETLDRETVQSVMQSVEPAVRACAGERHGTAQVDVVVQGTGRVTSATITGNFQGSPEGSCIARAVRGARFPQFTGEALRFRYPYGI
jgi:hypothetical protein